MAFLQAGRGEGPFGGDGREAILNVPPVVFWLIAVLAAAHVLRVFMPPATAFMLLHQFAFTPKHVASIDGFTMGRPCRVRLVRQPSVRAIRCDGACDLVPAAPGIRVRRGAALRGLALPSSLWLERGRGALLYLATSWNSPVGIAGATGAVAGVAMAAIRATWMRQAPPATHPPPLASVFSPQVLAFLIFWAGLSFVFAQGVVLPTGVGVAIVWQPAVAGTIAGMVLAKSSISSCPKSTLAVLESGDFGPSYLPWA